MGVGLNGQRKKVQKNHKPMNQDKQNITLAILAGTIVLLGVFIFTSSKTINVAIPPINIPTDAINLAGVTNYLDTSSSDVTHATSTVNTTSTQVFASITKIGQITNDTTGKLTCSMDATGTTAASSTVSSGRGIIISPAASTTPNMAMFGECYPGSENCYAHKGAVNCLSTGAVTITTWKK